MAIITITTSDHEGTVIARVGDDILVRLSENPTTGYRWDLQTVSGPISPAGDDYTLSQEQRVGSGGVRELRFRATGEGHAQLRLQHKRSWEDETSSTERLAVDITIVP